MAKTVGLRGESPREFWTEKVRRWQRSGKTQSVFCRENGLNLNSFNGWKQSLLASRQSKDPSTQAPAGYSASPKPSFLRFPISDSSVDQPPHDPKHAEASPAEQQPRLAAELLDVGSGRRVRIFNGADQSTIDALLSAFSSNSSGF